MTLQIGVAEPRDLFAVLELLKSNKLPLDGLSDHLNTIFIIREGEHVAGSAALEIYGTAALLISVAVERRQQGKGWGKRITHATLEYARAKGLTHVYLLTETALDFFAKFGFRTVDRSQVPQTVRNSAEFTSACPVSATVMMFQLEDESKRSEISTSRCMGRTI